MFRDDAGLCVILRLTSPGLFKMNLKPFLHVVCITFINFMEHKLYLNFLLLIPSDSSQTELTLLMVTYS